MLDDVDDLIGKHCGFVWFFSCLQYATKYEMLLRNTTSGNVTQEKVRSLLRFLYKPLSTVILDYFTVFNPFQQSLEKKSTFLCLELRHTQARWVARCHTRKPQWIGKLGSTDLTLETLFLGHGFLDLVSLDLNFA